MVHGNSSTDGPEWLSQSTERSGGLGMGCALLWPRAVIMGVG